MMKTTENNLPFRKDSCAKWNISSHRELNKEYARLEKLNDLELSELMDGMDIDSSSRVVKNLVSRKIEDILHTRSAA